MHNPSDLSIQATKVDHFAIWAGLKVNNSKSGISAILHEAAQRQRVGVLSTKLIETSKRKLQAVEIGGKSLPFLHPDKDAYKYLGVMFTLTLNWTY